MKNKRYISRLILTDGVILTIHAGKSRAKGLVDLWHRLRFFVHAMRRNRCGYPNPFRLIRCARACLTMTRTFDANLLQSAAAGSIPTDNVGKFADRDVSPTR